MVFHLELPLYFPRVATNSDACQMVGVWRSLVAHTLGVRVVAGSNPATPTNLNLQSNQLFIRCVSSGMDWQDRPIVGSLLQFCLFSQSLKFERND
jgi:hypothetical protein